MAISKYIMPICEEIFEVPGILSGPFLMFGYQVFDDSGDAKAFEFKDVKELLVSRGVKDITVLDFFDARADLKYDMNVPVPWQEHEKYKVFFDIGCLEHVFDTRQCLENCLRMVKVGGFYVLVTSVNGYFGHGLHVLNPEAIKSGLALNGFEIIYLKFSTVYGKIIKDASRGENIIIWVVAKKCKQMDHFVIPQQQTPDEPENGLKSNKRNSFMIKKIKRAISTFSRWVWELLLDMRYVLKRSLWNR